MTTSPTLGAQPTNIAPAAAGRAADETQIVVFELVDERYGLDIATVFEIIRHQPITAVPQAPAFVRGVFNLRGRIIPVVDLRDRFGMAEGAMTKASRIVVCEAAGTRIGLIVDGVSEVLMIAAASIEPTPPASPPATMRPSSRDACGRSPDHPARSRRPARRQRCCRPRHDGGLRAPMSVSDLQAVTSQASSHGPMRVQLVNCYVGAAVDVLSQESGEPVSRGGLQLQLDPYTSEDVTAMVGVSGSLAGSIYLSMTEATARALVSKMLGQPNEAFDNLAESGTPHRQRDRGGGGIAPADAG
jgi:chemotaxis signal transduction protein